MTELYQAITSTVKEEANNSYYVPWPIHSVSRLFENCHHVYWSFKQFRWFRNSDSRDRTQGNPAVYAGAVHLLTGCSTTIENAVKIGLVAKCATDLLSRYRQVHVAYQSLGNAMWGKYPHSPRWKWSCLHNGSYWLFVPSLALSVRIYSFKLLDATSRVLVCTGRLFVEMFELSMLSRDIYLLTQGDDLTRFRATSEAFAEWDNYRKKISQNTQFLQEELDKRKNLTDRIMAKVGLESRSANFLTIIGQALGRAAETAAESGAELLDPIFTPGKITSISFAVETAHVPELPAGRYPPWIGHVPMPKVEGPKQQANPDQQNMPRNIDPIDNLMHQIGGAIFSALGVN